MGNLCCCSTDDSYRPITSTENSICSRDIEDPSSFNTSSRQTRLEPQSRNTVWESCSPYRPPITPTSSTVPRSNVRATRIITVQPKRVDTRSSVVTRAVQPRQTDIGQSRLPKRPEVQPTTNKSTLKSKVITNRHHPKKSNLKQTPQVFKTDTTEQYHNHLTQKRIDVLKDFQNLIHSQIHTPFSKITENSEILNRFIFEGDLSNVRITENTYELKKLREQSKEYKMIQGRFTKTNKPCFKIHAIEKVINPYLLIQYELKKDEYTAKGIHYEERIVFHGTKKANIESICNNNFNWRLRGTSRGFKFGQGVSFSPISNYSTHYGDNKYNKVMIAARIIVGSICEGTRNMIVPPTGYDTSINDKGHVYVKYDDNTFYPAYLIHYGGRDERNNENTNDIFDGTTIRFELCGSDDNFDYIHII